MADGGAASQDESSGPGNHYSILHIHIHIQTLFLSSQISMEDECKQKYFYVMPVHCRIWINHRKRIIHCGETGKALRRQIKGEKLPLFVWLEG